MVNIKIFEKFDETYLDELRKILPLGVEIEVIDEQNIKLYIDEEVVLEEGLQFYNSVLFSDDSSEKFFGYLENAIFEDVGGEIGKWL